MSPVTDLMALTEFAGCTKDTLPLARFTDTLGQRSVFLSINSADTRVGTVNAADLFRKIIDGHNAADIEMMVTPGKQHSPSELANCNVVRWLTDQTTPFTR